MEVGGIAKRASTVNQLSLEGILGSIFHIQIKLCSSYLSECLNIRHKYLLIVIWHPLYFVVDSKLLFWLNIVKLQYSCTELKALFHNLCPYHSAKIIVDA